jgi:mercuric ion transport protein
MLTPYGRFWAAVGGTIAVAMCCFTPILVVTLTALGLGALTRYLDYVLIPALIVLAFVTWRAYRAYARGQSARDIRP